MDFETFIWETLELSIDEYNELSDWDKDQIVDMFFKID